MGGFFESFLRVSMIVLIVGPVTAWVARVGAKERGDANESTERFTVRMPRAPRLLMAGCAVAFEVIMLVPYIWQGLSLGIWDHQLVWLGHGLALAALAVLVLFSMPRIDVDGEEISARNIVGMRKRTTFGHITAATLHTQMMSIALYAEQGKFSSVSLEGVCSSNLLIRLAEEGIEVADAVQAPMTKAEPVLGGYQAVDDRLSRHGGRLLACPYLYGCLRERGHRRARHGSVPIHPAGGCLAALHAQYAAARRVADR